MKMCQRHWDLMRAAVEARGMSALVAPSGASAFANLTDEIARGSTTDNFDPLMAMNWNIASNLLERLGPAGLYLLGAGDEDPIDIDRIAAQGLKDKYRGRTWPRCPICYANIAHELTCTEPTCTLDKADGYDGCIEWSADAIKTKFDAMMEGRR